MSNQQRVQRGVPQGGQWTQSVRHETTGVDLTEPGEVSSVGEGLSPISVAEVRRRMTEGSEVQVVYLAREGAEPSTRTVAKQTAYEMISTTEDGTEVHNHWAGVTVQEDANGFLIASDRDGTPYAAFLPTEGRAPLTGNPPIHPDLRSRHVEASRTNDPDILDDIAASPIPLNRATVATNPNTLPDTLARLAGDGSVKVRRNVAANPNTPPAALARLAVDPDEAEPGASSVAWNVANNPSTPTGALDVLAARGEDSIGAAVARHANTRPETLRALAEMSRRSGSGQYTRQAVASNPNTPPDVLASFEKSDGWTMPNVAANPSTPVDVLVRLADDTSTGNQVRAMVASNPSTPAAVVSRLVAEGDEWVRRHAAENPGLDFGVVDILSRDPDSRVRRAIAGRSDVPVPALRALTQDKDRAVRRAAVGNVHSSPDDLARWAEDPDLAFTVANHRSAPVDVLRRLAAQDEYLNVRIAAQRNLDERG